MQALLLLVLGFLLAVGGQQTTTTPSYGGVDVSKPNGTTEAPAVGITTPASSVPASSTPASQIPPTSGSGSGSVTETGPQGPKDSGKICIPEGIFKDALEFPRTIAKEMFKAISSILPIKSIPGMNATAGLFSRRRRSVDLNAVQLRESVAALRHESPRTTDCKIKVLKVMRDVAHCLLMDIQRELDKELERKDKCDNLVSVRSKQTDFTFEKEDHREKDGSLSVYHNGKFVERPLTARLFTKPSAGEVQSKKIETVSDASSKFVLTSGFDAASSSGGVKVGSSFQAGLKVEPPVSFEGGLKIRSKRSPQEVDDEYFEGAEPPSSASIDTPRSSDSGSVGAGVTVGAGVSLFG